MEYTLHLKSEEDYNMKKNFSKLLMDHGFALI